MLRRRAVVGLVAGGYTGCRSGAPVRATFFGRQWSDSGGGVCLDALAATPNFQTDGGTGS